LSGDVAVVIVTYETRDAAIRCVESVLAHGMLADRATRVIVVDNASTDGTADAVLARFGLDRVEVVPGARNAGFGSAANLGAERVPDASWYLVLNGDTELTPGALAALVAAGESSPEVAIVGPRIVGATGAAQLSVRGHPTRLALLHQHTALRFLRVGADAYERYRHPPAPEVLMGAAILVRGEDFRALRGFDPRYFLYFEDADLCRRAALRGRVLWFEETATVRHAGGASADHDRERALTWYLASLFAYVDRFHGRRAGFFYRAAFKPLFVLRLLTDAVRDALGVAAGRPGKREELRSARRFVTRGLWQFLGA
jgi:GT2 family glycosyltransferase